MWHALLHYHSHAVTTHDPISIACSVGYGSGQWTIYPSSPSEADQLWLRIAMAVHSGMLGVSASANDGIICVFDEPLWDNREVDRVLRVLRECCGVTQPLAFTSDMGVLFGLQGHHGDIDLHFYHAGEGSTVSTYYTTTTTTTTTTSPDDPKKGFWGGWW